VSNPKRHPAAITIRPPAGDAELDAFFQVAAAQFVRDVPAEIAGPDFRRFVETAPGADPSRIRGAFRDGTYLGGYLIDERALRIDRARLKTGCVGVVVTRPEFRGQGVAKTLMNDTFAYARARGHIFLMLHGLANFYEPFGYVDVFDATDHCLDREEVLNHPPGPYRARQATSADTGAMLGLYDRHFGRHPGSFLRDEARQRFEIGFAASLEGHGYLTREGVPCAPPIVAVDTGDTVRGYLFSPWGPLRAFGNEVATDDWPATLALLQHDARYLTNRPEPLAELRWPLPPDGLTATLLSDHFTVRAETLSRPRANWMAALVDPVGLVAAFGPIWEDRLRHLRESGPDELSLAIGDAPVVTLRTAKSAPVARLSAAALPIALPGKVVTQLVFGFRNPRWALVQPGVSVPDEMIPVLDALFPSVRPWIPATDGC
jgi:GNAT superfamily N-acetyltransferase